jgi:outer membrane protein TolC
MSTRRGMIGGGIIILLAAAAALSAATTLDQAVARALAKDRGLKSQVLNEEVSKANRDYAARQKLFHLDFAGSYRYATDAVEVTAANFPFSQLLHIPSDQVFLSTSKSTYDLKLGLVQPIWTGGMLANAVKVEEARQTAQADQTRALKVQVAGQVKTSYYTYRLLAARKRSLEALLETLDIHLKRVEAFYREELTRKSDLLETQAKLEETRMSIEEVSRQMAGEKIAFETLCDIPPEDIDPAAAESVPDYAASRAEFEARHPILRALDAQAAALALSGKVAAASRLPQVSGFGEFHYARPGLNFFEQKWKAYGLAGLALTIPVFNLNRAERDKAVIDVQRRQLENQRAQVLLDADKALKQLYESKRSLETRAASADRLIALAREGADLKEKLYAESQVSNLDYLAALADLERYQSLKVELALQLELVKVAVNTTIGKTGERP